MRFCKALIGGCADLLANTGLCFIMFGISLALILAVSGDSAHVVGILLLCITSTMILCALPGFVNEVRRLMDIPDQPILYAVTTNLDNKV